MQKTIQKPVSIAGVGLHTGCNVTLTLRPAPPDTGVVFRRVDLRNFQIEALRKHVSRLVLATTLMKKGVMLSTVEHLLSALYGCGVDNAYVDIDSLEVPIVDGSAQPFVDLVNDSGPKEQNLERTFLRVDESIRIEDGDKFISVEPFSGFKISYEIDFDHPTIGHQNLELEVTPESYQREIAFARTFGFYSEVEKLLQSGLIRGGSLDNAVVLSEDGVMSGDLRSEDEFVRHKVLDLIGDLSLCGSPLIGHVRAYKAGHALHTRLATELSKRPKQCRPTLESELGPSSVAAAS